MDETNKELDKYYPQIKVQKNATNKGHTRCVNDGLRMAKGDYVLVLDVDTEVPPTMLRGMLEFMRSNPDINMITPRTLNSDGTVQESARNFPSVMSGLFGRQSRLAEWFPNNPFTRRYLDRENLDQIEPFQVEQISGACMFFPLSLVDDAGYWDEKYFGYWVDTDWCFRLKQLGKKIYCLPGYKFYHHENNARGKRKSLFRIWLFHHGAYRVYTKWYTWGVLDPRSLFAAAVLGSRGLLIFLGNYWQPVLDGSPESFKSKS